MRGPEFKVLLGAVLTPFVLLRAFLSLAPETDLMIGGWEVHHLFTGTLLLVAAGVPLILGVFSRRRLLLVAGFGVGMSLVLDEWVYLIVTDGSNQAYLLPVSWWGGALMIGLGILYVVVCRRVAASQEDPEP